MASYSHKLLNTWLKAPGRALLKRPEMPRKVYEKRVRENMDNLFRVIRKGDVVRVEGRSEVSRIIQVKKKNHQSLSGLDKTERAVAKFCSGYLSASDGCYLKAGGFSIKYLDYDWSLNVK